MTKIVFVRHGQTADNLAGVFQGQSGRGLDETGRTQAARLAARLQGRRFAALVTSDLERAAETARILGDSIGLTPVVDRAFREIDVGGWAGLTADEARLRFPEEHAAWRDGKDVRRGGGESYSEVAARIENATLAVAPQHQDGTVLIVSHGTAIRSFTARVVGAPAQASRAWPVMTNCGMTVFSLDATLFRLLAWNDAAHLE
jgi:broad specificity phosphatase PhoE